MSSSRTYMNSWMVPKNKRTLLYIIDALPFFIANFDKGLKWKGQRALQRKFEQSLEDAGLKRKGEPYHPNSGGARTYVAQLTALGLIFLDNSISPSQYRPTLAGEAILKGADPLAVLQNQLFKFQYPSVYSLSQGVGINPSFKIRPFLFLLRLLLDQEIQYLTKDEIAKFILCYAKNDSDINEIKSKILVFRQAPDRYVPADSFLADSVSPKTKKHSMQKRIHYLKDKANIFINYLDSIQLVIRPDSKDKMEINPEYKDQASVFIAQRKSFIANPEDTVSFQRKYGLDLNKTKDTRSFSGNIVYHDAVKELLVKSRFFTAAKTQLILNLDTNLLRRLEMETGVNRKEIIRILDNLPAQALTYFEDKYLEMSQSGVDECLAFEIATQQIFSERLKYKAKHIGQIKPKDKKRGGNADVIFLSDQKHCGLIDTKAYKKYVITNDHKNRMVQNYIPNSREHSGGLPLKIILYVSGGFGSGMQRGLKDIQVETTINCSSITAKNLLRLVKKLQGKKVNHDRVLKLFSDNSEVGALEIDNYQH